MVVSRHEEKPVFALARFGSFAFSIETGTPKTAAISSMISSRPPRSFGGNESGLMSISAVATMKRPALREPSSLAESAASNARMSASLAPPLMDTNESGRALFWKNFKSIM